MAAPATNPEESGSPREDWCARRGREHDERRALRLVSEGAAAAAEPGEEREPLLWEEFLR
jgi:hypothetical protein